LLPYDDDISNLQFIIEGPVDTPYHTGRFRIALRLQGDFPAAPPKGLQISHLLHLFIYIFVLLLFCTISLTLFIALGLFLTKIFHPNVSASGEICVNTLKKDWQPSLGLKHILLVGYLVFYAI
jgi:ubiquitin-conjugating enzyme E2 S